MLFKTPEQFVVLAVLLLGGLLIGYACAPSPRKWKRRVRDQSESFTEHYTALEAQLRAARQRVDDLTVQTNALRADTVEAERTIGSLRAAAAAAVVAEPTGAPRLAELEAAAPHAAMPEPIAPTAIAVAEPADGPPAYGPIAQDATESQTVPKVSDAEIDQRAPVPETSTPVPAHAVAKVLDETRGAAPVKGDTFPVVEDADPPREDVASLPADSAPTAETSLSAEPAIEHRERPAEAPMTPVPTDAPPAPIGAAEPEMPSKGWFASSARDDLTRVRGIDGVLNTRLFSLGVVRFEDLEKLSAEDEMALEQRLALPVGYIAREQWRTQSALLRAGKVEEHARHFGAEPAAVG